VEAKAVSKVEKSLDEVARLIDTSEDFKNLLASPVVSSDDKSAVVDAILAKAGFVEMVANFLRTVARNGRLLVLPAMISSFKDLAAEARDELRAEVTSATQLSKKQISDLARTLKSKMGKTITLNTNVDPSLIGGLIVKVGSQMIDSSLKTKLTAMKIAMKEVR
jgi:F-type H+-transporting ATPase subunit delta